MKIKVYEGGYAPIRAHYNDAGADLRTPEAFVLKAHSDYVIDTKVAFEIPDGYFGKLESKSGLNVKASIVCPGGVVDSGYRGTVVVKLENHSGDDYIFDKGYKIVQIVFLPCLLCTFEEVEELDPADRGASGFGSTGK